MSLKILIVGGYGTFGGRLVELLENRPELTLVVSGRSLEKAEDFCKSRNTAKATLVPAQFDRAGNLQDQISAIAPDIIVDASGPFQAYGGNSYSLVKACINNKISYMDLADGTDFVEGIAQFDAEAKAAGVFILSGVSSFPVLSAAVVRELSKNFLSVESIRAGIAPSPYAGVGTNVIKAIAGYAGQEIEIHQAHKIRHAYPLTETMRYTIAPPGKLPLHNKLFSLVDVPDLKVLSTIRLDAKDIWVGAGPVPEILHILLILLSWLVRLGFVKTLLPIASLMEWCTTYLRWGEHRGGMFVEIKGSDEKGVLKRSWHLLAEGRDGPLIPSMAIEAIICKMQSGVLPQSGARTALDDLDLRDYDELFESRTIYTGLREDRAVIKRPLYKTVLGDAYHLLPEPIRELHDFDGRCEYEGRAVIRRGAGKLSNLIASLFGFPEAAEDAEVRVGFSDIDGIEKWTRYFNGKKFSSYQSAGKRRSERLIVERFGIFNFALALVVDAGRLHLITRRWNCLGISLPLWLAPRSDSFEYVEEGRFHFNVEISHPLMGLIVHYRGSLARKS